jgi:Copper amine oxidase, enzyme domain
MVPMNLAFSQREGIALSTITYNDDGVLRPLFYRLSLAEMVVPYGAPEYPHPRKFAFDRCADIAFPKSRQDLTWLLQRRVWYGHNGE